MIAVWARLSGLKWILVLTLIWGGEHVALAAGSENESPANSPSRSITPSASPEVDAVMEHLEPLWDSFRTDIVSSDAKFQIYYQIKPQSSLSQAQIHEQLDRYQFAGNIEQVTAFLTEVAGPRATFVAPIQHLLEQGEWTRHNAGPVSYIHLSDFSFIVEPDNKQIHVYDPGLTPTTPESLLIFRAPMKSREEGHLPTRVERDGQLVHLESIAPPNPRRGAVTTKSTIDWATGVPLMRSHSLDSKLIQDTVYSGLTTFSGGVTLPRYSTTIRYELDRVSSIELAVLTEATFNEPIPEQAFVQNKPENWKILDFRGDSPGREIHTPSEAVADVRTLIPETTHRPQSVSVTQQQQSAPMSIPMRAVLILNGTAFIALGIWMWKHTSLGGQKP